MCIKDSRTSVFNDLHSLSCLSFQIYLSWVGSGGMLHGYFHIFVTILKQVVTIYDMNKKLVSEHNTYIIILLVGKIASIFC